MNKKTLKKIYEKSPSPTLCESLLNLEEQKPEIQVVTSEQLINLKLNRILELLSPK